MKSIGFAIYDLYRFFFDAKINPLRHMPNVYTQYLLMFYLSVMWTAVFTIWTGSTIYFGIGSVGAHLLVITAKAATSPPKAARPWDQCSSNSVMFSSLAASLSRISLNVLLVTC